MPPLTAHRFFSAPASAVSAADEARFFASIRLANGTFKTTSKGRMPELDRAIAEQATRLGFMSPHVLDAGASSGVTTVELRSALRTAGLTPSILAVDGAVEATLIEAAPGLRVLRDRSGHDLQYDIAGFAIRPWTRRLDYVTGYRLLTALARMIFSSHPRRSGKPVRLISRHCAEVDEIDFIEADLSEPNSALAARFDIVRAANMLNREYFAASIRARMISTLIASLRGPSALLAINRTHRDGTNHGSIFRLEPSRTLTLIERIGRGSEVEAEVLGSLRPERYR